MTPESSRPPRRPPSAPGEAGRPHPLGGRPVSSRATVRRRNDVARTVGANVAALRKAAGLSQDALGRAIGCSATLVHAIEVARVDATVERLGAIARAVGQPVTALFEGAAEAMRRPA